MNKLKKRTNNTQKAFEIVFKSFIPILLSVLFIFDGFGNTVTKILRMNLYLTQPEGLFHWICKSGNITSTEKNDKNYIDSEITKVTSNSIESNIPEDVLSLMYKAQETYAKSSNDGKILEYDYSLQNATSEFNGVYLRNTTLNHPVNISDYIDGKVYARIDKTKPVVLIYHTHTSETYELLDRGYYTNERSTRSDSKDENMIRIGEEICKTLEENGYKTIHDKTIYDTEYSGAYDRSLSVISKIIDENPSIQIALDVHRGTIYQKDGTKVKTVTTINNTKAAQIMIISGCEDGNVTDFPDWEKNLSFALNLQKQIVNDNPKLVRPLMFCSRKYNMDVLPCALQIEIGTDANTLAEAVFSARMFALSLSELLKEYVI